MKRFRPAPSFSPVVPALAAALLLSACAGMPPRPRAPEAITAESLSPQAREHRVWLVSADHQLQLVRAGRPDRIEQQVALRTREVRAIQDVTILAMASLAETRDADTGNHIRRTQYYVRALAERLRRRRQRRMDGQARAAQRVGWIVLRELTAYEVEERGITVARQGRSGQAVRQPRRRRRSAPGSRGTGAGSHLRHRGGSCGG